MLEFAIGSPRWMDIYFSQDFNSRPVPRPIYRGENDTQYKIFVHVVPLNITRIFPLHRIWTFFPVKLQGWRQITRITGFYPNRVIVNRTVNCVTIRSAELSSQDLSYNQQGNVCTEPKIWVKYWRLKFKLPKTTSSGLKFKHTHRKIPLHLAPVIVGAIINQFQGSDVIIGQFQGLEVHHRPVPGFRSSSSASSRV